MAGEIAANGDEEADEGHVGLHDVGGPAGAPAPHCYGYVAEFW